MLPRCTNTEKCGQVTHDATLTTTCTPLKRSLRIAHMLKYLQGQTGLDNKTQRKKPILLKTAFCKSTGCQHNAVVQSNIEAPCQLLLPFSTSAAPWVGIHVTTMLCQTNKTPPQNKNASTRLNRRTQHDCQSCFWPDDAGTYYPTYKCMSRCKRKRINP